MDAGSLSVLAAWVTEAGLAGKTETAILDGFCRRAAAAGLPIARAMLVIDTLHPVYEGRVFRWRDDAPEGAAAPPVLDAAFLVPANRRVRFKSAARRLAADSAKAGAEITLSGPWPAYNFVNIRLKLERA